MTIKVNTANLEGILTRIWSGELEHNQGEYFCGTACCVAGWDVALNFPEDYADYIKGVGSAYDLIDDPFEWSMLNNNLNNSEAVLIFDGKATQYLQQKTLEALKAGRRLDIQDGGVRVRNQGWQHNHYSSGVVQIYTNNKEDHNALIEFLDDFDNDLVQVL